MSRRLLKSTAVVSAMTMVSRVLGFVRDMVFATIFGAGAGTDAFFVAFKIPNFLRRLFAEGAFSQAFVPVLSEYKTQRSHAETKSLVADVAGTLGGVLLLVTVVAMLAAPLLVLVFAPGFRGTEGKFALTSDMLRITFPYLFFISLTAFAGGILNSFGKFALPALTPVWLNIILIAAAVWASPYFTEPVMALAWGVFLAGLVQLLFQFPALMRLKLFGRPRWAWHHEGVRRILNLMLPAIFGSSVAQINLLLDTIIASFLVTGSVSWLYYSDRLVEFPLGVFGIALATVILPSLSQRHAEANPDAFAATLDWGLRWVLLIALPAMVGLILLAGPIIATLYHRGAFTEEAVRMSALSLMALGMGLPAFMLIKVLAPGFYARQDTRTPMRIGVRAMVTNMGLNILFVVPMVWFGVPGPHAGLALATTIAAFTNAGQLFWQLRKAGVYVAQPGWRRFALQLLVANGVLLGVLLSGMGELAEWLTWSTPQQVVRLGGLIAIAALVYLLALLIVGVRPAQLLARHK
ncbi:MAG TPA: murein biosynthesis integral membrane protein MurJ [Gammaproteobacteria bacterium]